MDHRAKKNLQEFKKEITKQIVQRKKVHLRKSLPFYKQMFKDDDQLSDPTHSRPTRLPIRECPNRAEFNFYQYNNPSIDSSSQHHTNQGQKQIHDRQTYLKTLRNLDRNFSLEDQHNINKYIIKNFGELYLSDLSLLRDLVQCKVIDFQNDNQCSTTMNIQDWTFIVASFKFGNSHGFEEIVNSCFNLLTTCFNEWNSIQFHKIVLKRDQFNLFLQNSTYIEEIGIRVENIIFSFLLQSYKTQINDQHILLISRYLQKKIQCFKDLKNEMDTIYKMEELQYFFDMIFNLGFTHAVQTLSKIAARKNTNKKTKLQIFTLVNNYLIMYPNNCNDKDEETQKFTEFIEGYIAQLIDFASNQIKRNPLEGQDYAFLNSTLQLIESLLWRDFNAKMLEFIVKVYETVLQICLFMNATASYLFAFKEFQMNIVDIFLLIFTQIDGIQQLIDPESYFQYFSLLALQWFEVKLSNQNHAYFENNKDKNISLLVFQRNLISSIYLIKQVIEQRGHADLKEELKVFLQNTRMIYFKEQYFVKKFDSSLHQQFRLVLQPNVERYLNITASDQHKQIKNPDNNFYRNPNPDIQI